MEAVICKNEGGSKKKTSEMDVEALPLEEDSEKSNSETNIDGVSTDYTKKESSENMESLCSEDDYKYSSTDNMVPI